MIDEYLKTVDRLEPEISPVDTTAALTSIAISLKRIADMIEFLIKTAKEQGAFDK